MGADSSRPFRKGQRHGEDQWNCERARLVYVTQLADSLHKYRGRITPTRSAALAESSFRGLQFLLILRP